MAAEAAMRAGAGYVTALVPASLNLVFEQRLLEVMSVPLPDKEGTLTQPALEAALERVDRADALVLGPGLGRKPGTFKLARKLAAAIPIPLLLDADGLNAHEGRLEALAERAAATVLTPHAGELARLLETDSGEIAAHRLRCARDAAARANAVVLLKGDDTIVVAPDGRAAVSRGGAPALATAGTGDVLSGVIGAYLSKGMDPFHAACAGVFVHARAGRLAERTIGAEGVIAGDVIALLPRARAGDDGSGRHVDRPHPAASDHGTARTGPRQPGRDRAQRGLPARAGSTRRPSCARWSRPTPPVTAPSRWRGPRWPAGRRCWRWPPPVRRQELRGAGLSAPMLVMGAVSSEELPVALGAGAEVVAWDERFVAELAAAAVAPRPADRSADRRPRQARQRHGPAGHARHRRGPGRGRSSCTAPRPGSGWPEP